MEAEGAHYYAVSLQSLIIYRPNGTVLFLIAQEVDCWRHGAIRANRIRSLKVKICLNACNFYARVRSLVGLVDMNECAG